MQKGKRIYLTGDEWGKLCDAASATIDSDIKDIIIKILMDEQNFKLACKRIFKMERAIKPMLDFAENGSMGIPLNLTYNLRKALQ